MDPGLKLTFLITFGTLGIVILVRYAIGLRCGRSVIPDRPENIDESTRSLDTRPRVADIAVSEAEVSRNKSWPEKYPTLHRWIWLWVRLGLAYMILHAINYYCADIGNPNYTPSFHSRIAKEIAHRKTEELAREHWKELQGANFDATEQMIELEVEKAVVGGLFTVYGAGLLSVLVVLFYPRVKHRFDRLASLLQKFRRSS